MKKSLIALAALAATGAAFAQSSVTLFGVVDLAYENVKTNAGRVSGLSPSSNSSSRIGFRGVEDLGGGLSAVFRLEQGINLDDGTLGQGGRAFGREPSVGLASTAWGTVTAGRLPTPYYVAQSGVDAFSYRRGRTSFQSRSRLPAAMAPP